MTGPLDGLTVLELAGLGPGPFAGMMLADMGADVIRIDRVAPATEPPAHRRVDVVLRGRRSLTLDLRSPRGADIFLDLVATADVVIEGFRPGVVERLGIGPDECCAVNERIVYGRVTGWGQDGPLAQRAGHDITYAALSGALHAIGPRGGPPVVPLNIVGDYAGGAMMLVTGILGALVERGVSGRGQVVDAAMVDGAATMMSLFMGAHARGEWTVDRGTNRLDGGAPYYRVYECADGRHVAVGALERKFYVLLMDLLGREAQPENVRTAREGWEAESEQLAVVFAQKPLQDWSDLFEGTDACVAPILSMEEAPAHPHNLARGVFVDVHGLVQPAPAPRFGRTPSEITGPPAVAGEHTVEVLGELGLGPAEIDRLVGDGVTSVWTAGEDAASKP